MSTERAQELFNVAYDAAMNVSAAWADWLVGTGYGIDFYYEDGSRPPCTLRELAEAYERRYAHESLGDGMTVEDWMECIEAESGKW